jgi:hypothetical protein
MRTHEQAAPSARRPATLISGVALDNALAALETDARNRGVPNAVLDDIRRQCTRALSGDTAKRMQMTKIQKRLADN